MDGLKTNNNLPTFLFVGTAKAGTTSIYQYLLQHPDIEIPVKETFFFLREVYQNNDLPFPQQRPQKDLILDEDTYLNTYRGLEGKLTGEIGTGYLYYYEQTIPLIKQYLSENVKICIVLRNPIERAFSGYLHHKKDLHDTLDFQAALQEEEKRQKTQWDFMWYYRDLGNYYQGVKAFKDNFKHVKVMTFDDLKKNPQELMSELFEFIGVEPITLEQYGKHNVSGKPKIPLLQKMITQENGFKKIFRPLFRAVIGSPEKREHIRKYVKNKNLAKGRESLDTQSRQLLLDYYRADIENLSELIELDLSAWLS